MIILGSGYLVNPAVNVYIFLRIGVGGGGFFDDCIPKVNRRAETLPIFVYETVSGKRQDRSKLTCSEEGNCFVI